MISFRSSSNKEKTWTFSLRNETWEDCPTLQISYARAQRETQGAPQTLPFVFFWGRPIKMSLFKKLSGKWTSSHWMWVCWTWGKSTFPYFRSEHSKKWNHFQHLKTLGLMCLKKAGNRITEHRILSAFACGNEMQTGKPGYQWKWVWCANS